MNEAAEAGSSLWPAIALAVYWAYLLVWHERQKQSGGNTLFSSGLPPSVATEEDVPSSKLAGPTPGFDQDEFLRGAGRAYEFILTSYAAGKIGDLAELLDPGVLDAFSSEAERRKTGGRQLALSLVALSSSEIVDTESDDEATVVSVRFEAEIFVSEGKSSTDAPAAEAAQLLHAVDLWTFRKEHKSKGPVWLLVATA